MLPALFQSSHRDIHMPLLIRILQNYKLLSQNHLHIVLGLVGYCKI